ncbi:Mo-dependent nitrogenase C-terminal domain-containing protein [Leptolyngbya sp. AN03gr2]|uniref:Mo-dependent nitrogenase C-terminal domain-containing protein n=1 Tax=Leptolyngbya sp. AN03gr2 TaxID=3423364 RepID=UPI003D319467
MDHLEIRNDLTAKIITKLILSACPFERNIVFGRHTIAHVPPLCKLNPFYEQLVGLRFRALQKLEH